MVGMLSTLRGGGAVFDANGRQANNVVGAGSDADFGLLESGEDVAADLVLQVADVVSGAEEADGELDPVVGDAEKTRGGMSAA